MGPLRFPVCLPPLVRSRHLRSSLNQIWRRNKFLRTCGPCSFILVRECSHSIPLVSASVTSDLKIRFLPLPSYFLSSTYTFLVKTMKLELIQKIIFAGHIRSSVCSVQRRGAQQCSGVRYSLFDQNAHYYVEKAHDVSRNM